MIFLKKLILKMKFSKAISLVTIAFGSILSVSAQEYKPDYHFNRNRLLHRK